MRSLGLFYIIFSVGSVCQGVKLRPLSTFYASYCVGGGQSRGPSEPWTLSTFYSCRECMRRSVKGSGQSNNQSIKARPPRIFVRYNIKSDEDECSPPAPHEQSLESRAARVTP